MPNIVSAKKRARQNIKRRAYKGAQRSEVRTFIKRVIKLTDENQKEKALEAYQQAQSMMDRAARKRLFPRNKISRLKSRLIARVTKVEAKT